MLNITFCMAFRGQNETKNMVGMYSHKVKRIATTRSGFWDARPDS